jgi:hypothetical protein
MQWGKVMLLPYFRPQGGVNLGIVNPARHFVDTSGALWYYGLGQTESEPTYLIGSDSPEAREILAVGGEIGQNNPPFYHELLAALAILDFYAEPTVQGNHPIRHFSETAHPGAKPEANALVKLPGPTRLSQTEMRKQLALLFHLASFSAAWRVSTGSEFYKGLFQYAVESTLTGWDDSVHRPLANERASLKAAEGPCHQVLEYFARLLLWGWSVLGHPKFKSSGLDFGGTDTQYASLHNTLCFVGRDEIEIPVDGNVPHLNDNLAAKTCRLGLAGLLREDASRLDRNHRGHALYPEGNALLPDGQTVRVGLALNTLAVALTEHKIDQEEIRKWFEAYQVQMS